VKSQGKRRVAGVILLAAAAGIVGTVAVAVATGMSGATQAVASPARALAPVAAVRAPLTTVPATEGRRSLQPWPITITIRTVPALPGIRFLFDDNPLVTGPQGTASFTERHDFAAHTLQLTQTHLTSGRYQYQFARWAGQRDPNQAFRPTVAGLPMRADYTVTASFSVSCQVRPRLVQQDGTTIPPGLVSHIELHSSTGQAAALGPQGTSWLPCARPVYRGSELYSRDVGYSVLEMLIDGTNVVHAGVQRFSPDRTPVPTVTGYFYALTITAHDALFGGAIGSYALLTMPDQAVRRVMLGPGHTATVVDLPEGNYQLQVKAAGASIPAQVVHLSKDQTADLAAVTHADLALTGGVFALAVAGIPLLSRTRRRRVRAFIAARLPRRGKTQRTGPGVPGALVLNEPELPGLDEPGARAPDSPVGQEWDEPGEQGHPIEEAHAEEAR
jgi:hypothetical protein